MKYKILIVDDEMMVREGLKVLIGTFDRWICVGEADNGVKALQQINQLQPDLVLSDIRMPEMDGLKLLEQIRSIDPEILVIFLTGYPDFEYAQTAVKFGAFDYLLKPMRAQDIAEAIWKAEQKVEQNRYVRQKSLQMEKVAADYEKSLSERVVREVIYSGSLERFDLREWPFFRMYAKVSVLNIIVEQLDAEESSTDVSLTIDERISESLFPLIALKDGRDEWVLLMGWKDNEDDALISFRIQELVQFLSQIAAPSIWKIGIGEAVAFEQAGLSYDQSKFAAYLASREKNVLIYHEISGSDQSLLLLPIEQEFTIMKHVRKGEADEALVMLRRLESHYRRMTLSEFTKHALQLHVRLQNSIAQLEEKEKDRWMLPVLLSSSFHDMMQKLEEGIVFCANRILKHRNQQMNHVIQRAQSIVQSQYGTELKLGDIALKLGMNASYLSTLFKQETGASFSDYLSRCRIEKSIELLNHSNLKIYEVAQQVGYTDGRHFSQLFRKTVGMTPIEYRNKHNITAPYGEIEYS
ncbi:hypothetical protein BK133_03625 [Paenibacillus sp. FSL H8-0548]|uniref:response regulator transcription factor n=1 Tax=Paenibacillus sp. FSL H8-0548 TaxID=1920422 RepID=UPI00096D0650|nr:response regulator [Paenibacillus sp. FSL H8-0548]OMF38078.1 hypothetical protein BK133_03625 [Paenibacillus sp. FSL H8-0548]